MSSLPQLLSTAGDFCVMRSDVIDKLLQCGDGDSALLYLYVLRQGKHFEEKKAARELGFTQERYERAVFTLTGLELASAPQEKVSEAPAQTIPAYRAAELRQARQGDHRFSAVCDAAEAVFGRTLTESQVRSLFVAYDHLGLPAEVIIELLTYLKNEKEMVKRRDIEREACLWADMGLFSVQAATEYLNRREAEKPLLAAMRTALGLSEERALSAVESRSISEFIARGFPPEAVAMAARRMEQSIGTFSWQYLRKILAAWDQKGVHTVAEITAVEPERSTKSTSPAPNTYYQNKKPQTAEATSPAQLSAWEQQWLEDVKARRQRRREENE